MYKKRKKSSVILAALLALGLLVSCKSAPAAETSVPAAASIEAVTTAAPTTEPSPAPTLAPTPVPTPSPEPTVNPSGELSVRFIDVGQADAALISCDGEHMLIDGGNREDSSLLYSLLEREGITHFQYVVGTHAHEDHIGGISGALQKATANLVLCPVAEYDSKAFANFKQAADANGGIVVPEVGDVYPLGSAYFTILGVNSDTGSTNNTSIVLRLVYGDTSFLFTGDAEREAEQIVVDTGYNLQSTVLKVGHHGSDTSTSYPFLREVMPQYAVISCGVDNQYGHPDEGVLSKLRDANAKLYRTDLQGDILCKSDGTTLTWETQKNAEIETNPTAEPAKPEIKEEPVSTPKPAPVSSGETFIGNANTKKVHHSYCSYLPQEQNRVYFDDLNSALNQGYVKCKKCF